MSAGASQTCTGRDTGSEAAIHAMRAIFEDTILMQISLLMLQMHLTLLTVKLVLYNEKISYQYS